MTARARVCALVLALAMARACFPAAANPVVVDDSGAQIRIPPAPCRIVSLSPGTTAMLYAAGAGHCLVATIAHSTEPAAAAKLPVIGDAENLDLEKLLALRPNLIVAAVDVVQRARVERMRALGIPVYLVHVTRLDGMPESTRRLGRLAGTADAADRSAAGMSNALAALRDKYSARARVRVLYQIWNRPIYTIGGRHLITDALGLCGATNVFGDLAVAAPAVTREAVVLRDPDLILISAPPPAAEEWLAEWRAFPAMKAVRDDHLFDYTDPRMDRMGPSVIEATAQLCDIVERARTARTAPAPGRTIAPAH